MKRYCPPNRDIAVACVLLTCAIQDKIIYSTLHTTRLLEVRFDQIASVGNESFIAANGS